MGYFIAFEGIEGAGKTTQIKSLATWLKEKLGMKRAVVTTREPGGTTLGQDIRRLLLRSSLVVDNAELLLFAADRAQHVDTIIRPSLRQGSIVLCDRFTLSTWAYQGYGRRMSLELIDQLNAIATNGVNPDLTIWIDLPVEVGLARCEEPMNLDRIERESFREGFLQAHQKDPDKIIRIDGDQSLDCVQGKIREIVQSVLLTDTNQPSASTAPLTC